METIYFVSDLHLRDMQEEKAQKLLRFFISLKDRSPQVQLFLVGDIFDLWLGDHDFFVKKFRPLVESLQSFVSVGGKLYFFEGNHDLHLKKFWEGTVGGVVYRSAHVFQLQNYQVRVEHGDQMDPEDKGYLFLRWFLRTWVMEKIILHLPGPIVAWLGEWASRQSRSYTNSKRDEGKIRQVIRHHAQEAATKDAFDILIAGHVHLRDEYEFSSKNKTIKSYNLGSWDKEAQVLQLQNQQWSWIFL